MDSTTLGQMRKAMGELGGTEALVTWDAITTALGQATQAEEEIELAQRFRPKDADLLHHYFGLLVPTHTLMATEFVYRSHVRELLLRAGSQDTRPGTWAEICCACCDMSQITPFNTSGEGLYIRAWHNAFPHERQIFSEAGLDLAHYEAIAKRGIDNLESECRRKLARSDRVVGQPSCRGLHHGEPATGCRFYSNSAKVRAA